MFRHLITATRRRAQVPLLAERLGPFNDDPLAEISGVPHRITGAPAALGLRIRLHRALRDPEGEGRR